ncbi:MAG: pseudouridine synthase [Polyangiaceae bacterium]
MLAPRRIDKYLRDGTNLSVVKIRAACDEGRVSLTPSRDASRTATAEDLVFDGDAVFLDGNLVEPRPEHVYLLFNKPPRVTTTVRDPLGKTDLAPWLREMPEGVFPIGRLDRDTSGALLLSNDGDFASLVLSPAFHTEKMYWLWLDAVLEDDDPRLLAFTRGIPLPSTETTLTAAYVELRHRTSEYTELHVTLKEGKNRQIRKMCNLLGLPLLGLHRKTIGPVSVGDLAPGQWRRLGDAEMTQVWSHLGGRARIEGARIEALARLALRLRSEGKPDLRLESWVRQFESKVNVPGSSRQIVAHHGETTCT